MIEKYRVHEVAKDLGIPSKDLIALLEANFPGEPKKHMTALTDAELNLVFDKFTRERSLPNLESYFALQSQRPKAPAPKPASKAEEQPAPPAAQPAPAPKAEEKPAPRLVAVGPDDDVPPMPDDLLLPGMDDGELDADATRRFSDMQFGKDYKIE